MNRSMICDRLVEGRQTIIQVFPDWLAHISPKSESPDQGEFKHLMLNKVKPNLEDLDLIMKPVILMLELDH